jgi:heme oxygenase
MKIQHFLYYGQIGSNRLYKKLKRSFPILTVLFKKKPSNSAIEELRGATKEVHEQLHSHAVFAALQNGQIDRAEYIKLLLALYGFHNAFVDIIADSHKRCQFLTDDLLFMGIDAERINQAPRMPAPEVANSAERVGIDYVIRGSSLGGRVLARKLDALVGRGELNGRRFFMSGGEGNGPQWHGFVEQLELLLPTSIERKVAAKAAAATFKQFDTWMTHIVASRPT